MKRIRIILLLSAIMLVLSACGEKGFYQVNPISGVDTFKQEDTEYLVYFYMPTCVHCQEFKPTLEKYVTQENALNLYKVNLALPTEQKTWSQFEVEGTPTLLLVKEENGKKVEVERFVGVQELKNIPVQGE